MSTELVSLRGVSKHFDEVKAVDQLDLSVYAGEFFSMLGPSGSGKTTVLRLIASSVVILLSLIPVYVSQRLTRAQEEDR